MSLRDPKLFFAYMRNGLLGPTLDDGEVQGCNAILAAMEGAPISHVAYALATAFLETAGTMQPVREAFWLSDAAANRYFFKMYDIAGTRPHVAKRLGNLCAGDGVKYPGMGYPQMTGRANYTKADAKLKKMGVLKASESLIDNPKLAMWPDVAAPIMRYGMEEGWFTGKKFSTYLPGRGVLAARPAFVKCRYIINGQDRAGEVADFAMAFQNALEAGRWQ